MTGLAAGDLRDRVLIEKAAVGDDGLNTTEVWESHATVWTRFIPARGQEAREQLGREATLLATFTVRASSLTRPIVESGWRLRFPAVDGGQVWDIVSVVPTRERDGFEIVARGRRGATS